MDDRRLTLSEHLEELRGHVARAVAYLFIAVVACLFWQDQLMRVVVRPQQRVAGQGRPERLARAAERLAGVLADVRDRPLDARPPAERAEVGERVDRALAALEAERHARLGFLAPQEPFFAYLKVTFICALFLASPFVGAELWRFVAEGLRAHERRWVRIFGPVSLLCFAAGAVFGYFVLIPVSLDYLEGYGSRDLVVPMITLDAYLGLFLGLTFAVGLAFEVPVVLVFLSLISVVDAADLRRFRRYWLFVATVAAAVITPTGDPMTLTLVALPLIALYELGIQLVNLLEKKPP